MTELRNAVSPYTEMLSYETLWASHDLNRRAISELFEKCGRTPSEVLKACFEEALISDELTESVKAFLAKVTEDFSVCLHGDFNYPTRIRSADYPLELFYYRGDIGLTESPCVSVVGARECSEDGKKRAARLARGLVAQGYTVVSGLAAGIDTAAMTAAIESNGKTVGVIGTPIDQVYPKQNRDLQERVAKEFLLVSQVPFYRHKHEPFTAKRYYFPQRNETMAALSEATIIVEASEKSGSLTQARSAIKQRRKLFILNSCFERGLTWPHRFEKQGAVRVRDFDDIFNALETRKDAGTALEEN